MPGDPGRLPAPVSPAAPAAGPAALAAELLGRVRPDLQRAVDLLSADDEQSFQDPLSGVRQEGLFGCLAADPGTR